MKYRIHGDNIIECERALNLIALAFNAEIKHIGKNIYMPSYSITKSGVELFDVELLGGHDRWGVNFNSELVKYGAPLREATDAYITLVQTDNSNEQLLIAIEFCNALPAGNNAWQRNGRAITCAEVGVPYFYFAEIGGVELDSDRAVIAPRFPNPIVPFSYITSSKNLDVICVPVYQAHPAISDVLRNRFTPIFGLESSLVLLKSILEKKIDPRPLAELVSKGLDLVKLLTNDRKRQDTFSVTEWEQILHITEGVSKANWISKNKDTQYWKKKSSEKVLTTDSFKKLLNGSQAINLLSIGAKEIPICLVSKENISNFTSLIKNIYSIEKVQELVSIIEKNANPFVIVWVNGFKPKGDDSRPDRGLVPLARMLFGNDIEILTIVYGPAVKNTWKILLNNSLKLSNENGLWQAVLNLSNYVLADSATSEFGPIVKIIKRDLGRKKEAIFFASGNANNNFGEHDVDTAIHALFSRQLDNNVFESMCNPPGGDWSGISYWDFTEKVEFRWTSLPRVSATAAKRPDHIIQLNLKETPIFLIIESKHRARSLDENIGNRLLAYATELFKIPPTAILKYGSDWELFNGNYTPLNMYKAFSGGAFVYENVDEMRTEMLRGGLDFIFAFEFHNSGRRSIGHLLLSEKCKFLESTIILLADRFKLNFEIKIY